MDIAEAIRSRKSIQGFTSTPVDKKIIEQILQTVVYAPSTMNTQPWEFTVLSGQVLDSIREENVHLLRTGAAPEKEAAGNWPKDSIYRHRQVDLA